VTAPATAKAKTIGKGTCDPSTGQLVNPVNAPSAPALQGRATAADIVGDGGCCPGTVHSRQMPRPKPIPMGPVIARRVLQQLKPKKKLVLELGSPRRHRGHWACPLRIRGHADGQVHLVSGGDGIQALDVAIQFARTLLEPGDNILWYGVPVRDIFPRSIPNWGDTKAYRRMIRLVEKETAAYEPRYWRKHPRLKKALGEDRRTKEGKARAAWRDKLRGSASGDWRKRLRK